MSEANAEDGLLWSWTIKNVKMSEAQYRNRICILFFVRPEFRQNETDGASGGFLPRPLLLRLRNPNQSRFCQIPSPENSLAKPSPHCSATCPNTWRAEHQRKMSFPLSRKISPPPNQESKRHFSLVLPRE